MIYNVLFNHVRLSDGRVMGRIVDTTKAIKDAMETLSRGMQSLEAGEAGFGVVYTSEGQTVMMVFDSNWKGEAEHEGYSDYRRTRRGDEFPQF